MSTRFKFRDRLGGEGVFNDKLPEVRPEWRERTEQMSGMEHRHAIRARDVEIVMHMTQEEQQRPLILLVRSWSSKCQVRQVISKYESGA
jgi:hypothetical protein